MICTYIPLRALKTFHPLRILSVNPFDFKNGIDFPADAGKECAKKFSTYDFTLLF